MNQGLNEFVFWAVWPGVTAAGRRKRKIKELPEVSTSLGQKRNPGPGLHYGHADAIPGRDVRLTPTTAA